MSIIPLNGIMRYSFKSKKFVVSEGVIPLPLLLLFDKENLSREDRFILEKHSQDLFKMLLRQILEIDADLQISLERKQKAIRLLDEFIETKTLLSQK